MTVDNYQGKLEHSECSFFTKEKNMWRRLHVFFNRELSIRVSNKFYTDWSKIYLKSFLRFPILVVKFSDSRM